MLGQILAAAQISVENNNMCAIDDPTPKMIEDAFMTVAKLDSRWVDFRTEDYDIQRQLQEQSLATLTVVDEIVKRVEEATTNCIDFLKLLHEKESMENA